MPRVYDLCGEDFALGLAVVFALPALFALVAVFAFGFFVVVCFAAVFFGGAFFAAVFFFAGVALVDFVADAVCLIMSCGVAGGDDGGAALAGAGGVVGAS